MPSPKRTPGQNSIASTRVKQSNASCYSDAFSGDRKNNGGRLREQFNAIRFATLPKVADDHEYISPGHAHMATRCQVERTSERESKDKDFCTAIIANSGSVFKRNVNFARTTATLGKTNASIPRDDDEEEEEEEEEGKKRKRRTGKTKHETKMIETFEGQEYEIMCLKLERGAEEENVNMRVATVDATGRLTVCKVPKTKSGDIEKKK